MASYRLRIGWSNNYNLTASPGNYTITGQTSNLTYAASGGGAGTITWTASPEATGYNLYWSTISGIPYANGPINVGNVVSYPISSISGLGTGVRYFNARPYDASGLEGAYTGEQVKTI